MRLDYRVGGSYFLNDHILQFRKLLIHLRRIIGGEEAMTLSQVSTGLYKYGLAVIVRYQFIIKNSEIFLGFVDR